MSDPTRVTDWGRADLQIVRPANETGTVVDDGRQVTAYFDDMNRPATPDRATWAKVWTPDGRLSIVTLGPR